MKITTSQCKQWEKWKGELVNLTWVMIPRCHHPSGYLVKDKQLHVFCDASELAYSVSAYLKFEFELEKPNCFFVMSKNKLAPMKNNFVTTPTTKCWCFWCYAIYNDYWRNKLTNAKHIFLDRFNFGAVVLKKWKTSFESLCSK